MDDARFRPGPHRVALAAAGLTLPLLFVGGSVTSYGVGLAVPDWPTTFGINMFLYNFWNDAFGVKLEHTHRLYGSAVGLATVVLAVWLLAFDRRRFMKVLGVVALAAVIAQGVMGGLRVARMSTTLAAFHGVFGQAFFGFMVVLCVLTGRVWRDADRRPDPARLRTASSVLLAMVFSQIVIGAWFRHFKTTPGLWTHVGLAAAVLGVAGGVFTEVARRKDEVRVLWPSAMGLGLCVVIQVALGLSALWLMLPMGGNPRTPTLWQAMLRTGHQTNGALLLGASVVFTMRAFRHLAPSRRLRPDRISPARLSGSAPRTMEVVA